MSRLGRAACLALALSLLLAGCGGAVRADSVPRDDGPLLVQADEMHTLLLNSAEAAAGIEVSMAVELALTGPTAHFSIGPEKPAGLRVQGVASGKGQALGEAPAGGAAFDEYGNLAAGYCVQLSALDLDGDGTYEVLASIGNRTDAMRTVVYRCQSGANEPFLPVGTIDGAAQMTVEDGVIHAPGGPPGESPRLQLEGNALVVVQDEAG